jgi:hypothetical protein
MNQLLFHETGDITKCQVEDTAEKKEDDDVSADEKR